MAAGVLTLCSPSYHWLKIHPTPDCSLLFIYSYHIVSEVSTTFGGDTLIVPIETNVLLVLFPTAPTTSAIMLLVDNHTRQMI